MNYKKLKKELSNWIKQKVEDAKLSGVVIGASGGIDSSVTIKLANEKYKNNLLALIMPCGNKKDDAENAISLLKKNNINYKIIDFEKIFNSYLDVFSLKNYDTNLNNIENNTKKLSLANLKARIRMSILYYHAQMNNFMVIGTGNRIEKEIGYFTKYGDGGVDLLPLADLFKSEVIELGKELGISNKILNQTPSGGLWIGQTDEEEIGLSYDELEYGIRKYYNLKEKKTLKIEKDKNIIMDKISIMIENNKHKVKMPEIYKIKRS